MTLKNNKGKKCGLLRFRIADNEALVFMGSIIVSGKGIEEFNLEDKKYLGINFLKGCKNIEDMKYDLAAEQFKKALNKNPKDARVWHNLGKAFTELRNYNEAIKSYKKAISLKPALIDSYINLGLVYEKIRRYKDVASIYKKAIRTNIPEIYKIFHLYGQMFMDLKQYKRAIGFFKEALERGPDLAKSGNIFYDLAFCYSRIGNYERAVENYKEAIELLPFFSSAYFEVGCCYEKLGKYNLAVDIFQKAKNLSPGYMDFLPKLITDKIKVGDQTGALREYKELQRQEEELKDMVAKLSIKLKKKRIK